MSCQNASIVVTGECILNIQCIVRRSLNSVMTLIAMAPVRHNWYITCIIPSSIACCLPGPSHYSNSQGAKLNNCANPGERVKFGMTLVFGVQNTTQGETKRNHHSGGHFGRNSKRPPNGIVHQLTFEIFTHEYFVIPVSYGLGCAESIYSFI